MGLSVEAEGPPAGAKNLESGFWSRSAKILGANNEITRNKLKQRNKKTSQ